MHSEPGLSSVSWQCWVQSSAFQSDTYLSPWPSEAEKKCWVPWVLQLRRYYEEHLSPSKSKLASDVVQTFDYTISVKTTSDPWPQTLQSWHLRSCSAAALLMALAPAASACWVVVTAPTSHWLATGATVGAWQVPWQPTAEGARRLLGHGRSYLWWWCLTKNE